MHKLDIVFGCFDFIVRPDGRHVFLEVNQAGQFLFVEHETGQPLLDAFSEFLRQGTVDFAWSPERVSVRYSELKEPAFHRLQRELALHVPVPEA
jgi:hypothetical protein